MDFVDVQCDVKRRLTDGIALTNEEAKEYSVDQIAISNETVTVMVERVSAMKKFIFDWDESIDPDVCDYVRKMIENTDGGNFMYDQTTMWMINNAKNEKCYDNSMMDAFKPRMYECMPLSLIQTSKHSKEQTMILSSIQNEGNKDVMSKLFALSLKATATQMNTKEIFITNKERSIMLEALSKIKGTIHHNRPVEITLLIEVLNAYNKRYYDNRNPFLPWIICAEMLKDASLDVIGLDWEQIARDSKTVPDMNKIVFNDQTYVNTGIKVTVVWDKKMHQLNTYTAIILHDYLENNISEAEAMVSFNNMLLPAKLNEAKLRYADKNSFTGIQLSCENMLQTLL